MNGPNAGWYWQPGRSRAHFYTRQGGYSLCNLVGRSLVEARDRPKCGTCQRVLDAQERMQK